MRRPFSLSLFALLSLSACDFDLHPRFGLDNGGGNGGQPPATVVANVGDACNPQAAEACNGGALFCSPLPDGGGACALPGAFNTCLASSACAAGLSCTFGYCLQPCARTADCADPLTACSPFVSNGADAGTFCLATGCGPDAPSDRDGYGIWQPCGISSPDAGDGTCVPVSSSGAGGIRAACQQAGAVTLGGACQFYRADGGPGFCAPGLLCLTEASGANRGLCAQACDESGSGGPACGAGSACVATLIPLPPPAVSLLDWLSGTGGCAQSCALDGGSGNGGCPSGTSCQNGALGGTPDDVCLP